MTLNELRRLIARLSNDQKTWRVDFQTRNLTRGEIAEARWLAVVLMRSDLFTNCKVRSEYFQHQSHYDICVAMLQMRNKRIRCDDLPELLRRLAQAGYHEESAIEMLCDVLLCCGQIKNFDDYAKTLQKRFEAHQAAIELSPECGLVRLDIAGGASPFQTLTTDQLIAQQDPLEWLLPGMFVRYEPAVIVGPSKSMKSSIAVDLCAALARGGQFLGQFAVERPFRVGYVSKHDERQALADLARRWSDSSGVDPGNLPNLIWSLAVADASDPAHLDHLRAWIRRHQLEVIVIDPLRLTSTDKQTQAEQLHDLVRCCITAGATPILCCQSRQAIPRNATLATDVSASLDFARQWMLIQRCENYSPGSGQHRLRMSFGGCAGQGGVWGVDIDEGNLEDPQGRSWRVTLRDVESIEAEAAACDAAAQEQKLQAKIRLAITRLDREQATKSKIREQSGISGTKFAPTWDQMIAAGEIAKTSHDPEEKRWAYARYHLADPATPKEKKNPVQSNVFAVAVGSAVRTRSAEKLASNQQGRWSAQRTLLEPSDRRSDASEKNGSVLSNVFVRS
ncbi:AAA family ATPase [Blastopirellula sp. J2-11]|uniref:AAA family ATPase n=1 Tax=Blastopirellula sp. J2-11 TaxID=2943192 RepID=UPI0021C79C68|nr:AAA family ATPase [Blastopirellula sp. J2-11]UUO06789.1 AAA family ATPase [Blastopirellula sp. J2-11]